MACRSLRRGRAGAAMPCQARDPSTADEARRVTAATCRRRGKRRAGSGLEGNASNPRLIRTERGIGDLVDTDVEPVG
jgi:hypothetical protein